MQYKEIIEHVAKTYGTPAYLVYPERFHHNINSFRNAFLKRYKKFILSYSFKTNYAPFILNGVLSNGCYAEVVSNMEYELALKLGFKGEHIILNGPIKKRVDLYRALLNKSIIHLDGLYEVDDILFLVDKYNLKNVKVGLRVNMEINTDRGKSAIQAGLKASRFGFTEDVLSRIIPRLKKGGVKINSVHGHTSSTNRVVENYKIICNRLLEVCEKYELNNLEYIDVGGGFFGAAPDCIDVTNKPTYEDYAETITSVLMSNSWFMKIKPTIVIEPGTSVVSNTFELLTKIYQHKRVGDKQFVMLDASIHQVKPMLGSVNYPFTVYSQNSPQAEIVADLVGSTCMEVDVVAHKVRMSNYAHGDLIVFEAEGAYRMNMTPTFINYQCPLVAIGKDNSFQLIRDRQKVNQVCDIFNL